MPQPQVGNFCDECGMAGALVALYREDGTYISKARRNRLKFMHDKCPGSAHCFCQHRLPDIGPVTSIVRE